MMGAYLLRALVSRGFTNIGCLKRPSSSTELTGGDAEKVDWEEGDLLDPESIWNFTEGKDVVFHCGAFVTFNPKHKKDVLRTNINGTADLVDACRENGVKFLVHCSSVSALGNPENGKMTDEESPWDQRLKLSPYAESKYSSEMEVFRANAEGLPAVIINPSLILGGGFWHRGTARLHITVSRGMPFYPMGTGGFVDARDVAEMMIELCRPEFSGQRFICNSENKTYREVLSRIADGLGAKPPNKPLKKWMIYTAPMLLRAGRKLGFRMPRLTKDMLLASHKNSLFDNSKSIEKLGFEYRPIDQTLDELSRLFREDHEKGKKFSLLPMD